MSLTDPRTAAFWAGYLASLPAAEARASRLSGVFFFDDTPQGAALCAAAVLSGGKTATSALADGPAPAPGDLEIVTEHDGTPRAVIRIGHVDYTTFGAVDEDFARAEGDGTLASWREIHLRCYGDRLAARGESLTEDTPLWRIFFTRVYPT